MIKRSAITIVVLFLAEIALASSSLNATESGGNSTFLGDGHEPTNNTNSYICSNITCQAYLNRVTNEINNSSSTGTTLSISPRVCMCQNNTTCHHNDCTFKNCTRINSEANCSSIMSRPRNEQCPANHKELNNEKKGRIFTITLNCPRCT
jgi:hypothetical protein